MIAYRIHNAAEPLSALLDDSRADGWVASDEDAETQPRGVSACPSIADLMAYAREYSMSALPGSLLVELTGERGDDDRDHRAVRVLVRRARILGSGERLVRAAQNRRVFPGAEAGAS